ncbi:hypothetical protein [Aquirufa novilacunae]|jgi:hypothetical protein|uniref:DUF1566 domain-containing protein n=1 Tax=Aquirufa novilacunae TaxID=3139305 RepID=A0ABW8TZB5_9BACT
MRISLIILSFLFISFLGFGQNNGINFQGVGRNSSGAVLATQKISLRFSVIHTFESGTVEYVESKEVTTNAQGIFSVVIGDGSQISKTGNFSDINWKINPKFLKVEMDPAGGSSFLAMGTTRLQSVPYAYYANGVNADNVDGVLSVSKGGTGVATITDLKSILSLDQLNNTSDEAKPISIATQAALDTKVSTSTLSSTLATKVATEIFSTTIATKANVSDLVLKAPINSPTFTGMVSGISKEMIGLSNVDNTADTAKPISILTQASLDTKVSTSTFTTTVALKENAANKSTAIDLGGGATSDVLFPTQKAVKSYVDGQINSGGVTDGGITTIKLADLAVTNDKLASGISKSKVGLANVENTALSTWRGTNTINTIGTITTGVWSGTTVAVEKGGTGLTSAGTNGQVLTTTGSGTLTWTFLTGVSSQTLNTTSRTEPFDLTQETGLNGSSVNIRAAENLANGSGSLAANLDGIANVGVGIRTLNSNTTGTANTALGFETLYSNTVGQFNTGVGTYSLRSNTTGSANSALGSTSLLSNTTGYGNVAIGEWSLLSNTIGSYNTGLGVNTLIKNTTGNSNLAVGSDALKNNTIASWNTALGVNSLRLNTVGVHNTTAGAGTLELNTSGENNTAMGSGALHENISASWNTAVGMYASFKNSTGMNNTSMGGRSIYYNTSGSNNVAMGYNTLSSLTSGSNNTAIGSEANVATGAIGNSTVIGANATVSASNTIQLGNADIVAVKTAGKLSTGSVTYPNAHGSAGQVLSTTGSGTLTWTTLTSSPIDLVNSSGILSIVNGGTGTNTQNFVDLSAAQTIAGSKIFSSDVTINELRIGKGPGNLQNNIVIGREAFTSNTTGVGNTAIGDNALHTNNAGDYNTALGDATLALNTTGNRNTAIGSAALYSNYNGVNNSAFGVGALTYNIGGVDNVGVGKEALHSNSNGSYNIGIGTASLQSNTSGSNNTAVGNSTGLGIISGNNNTIIGANVTGLSDVSNHIILANGSGAIKARHDGSDWTFNGSVSIGSSAPVGSAKLEVNSTTQGFLLPRMTTVQRDAISSPAQGLSIYNTTTKGNELYNGTAWVPTTHYVGESYGGGTVFYVYDNGRHGLITANTIQSTGAFWRAGTDINTMALADGVGAGLKNTAIIIASQGYGNGDVYAARICNEYSVTENGVTYADWYLPSNKELQLLMNNRSYIPNDINTYYWSSTEASQGTAYFDTGVTNTKNNWYYVRAIRSF